MANDGGLSLFDVAEAPAVKKAEQTMDQASMGLRSVLPDSLQRAALGLELWQWVAIPLLAVVLTVLALLATRASEVVLRRFSRPKADDTAQDTNTVQQLRGPLRLWWWSLFAKIALPLLSLPPGASAVAERGLKILVGLSFFWAVLRAVSAWSEHFATSAWAQARPGSRALVSLASRIARFALMGLAVLATLSELGFSVTSVLAGLGIGGLAVALGAQKTLENVFGAFALAVDQPIREGELVKVEDVIGHVESIGLRSTRIRTLDRTLVTIPNGKLAELRLESFAARDRLRYFATLGLVYGTTAKQLRAARDGIEQALKAHESVLPETVAVNVTRFADSAIELELTAFVKLTELDRFRYVREELMLQIMEAVEKAGTSFAFPTRTVHVVPRA